MTLENLLKTKVQDKPPGEGDVECRPGFRISVQDADAAFYGMRGVKATIHADGCDKESIALFFCGDLVFRDQ